MPFSELGTSAEAEISPHTIELENRTFSLQGTMETQLKELRQILRTLYYQRAGTASARSRGLGCSRDG